jgi:acetyl esterase/lipase
MKTLCSFILCLVIVCVARATSAVAGETPGPIKYQLVEDVVYGNKDGMGLTLDVLTPETGAKHVGVILVSSGGWRSSKSDIPEQNERRRNSEHWVQGLLQGGYTLFLTRHGSAPRYFVPEMIEDVRRGVRFVRLHAERFGIDPDHLGITSGSSGGHLALMVATTGDDGKPDSRDPVERTSSRVQAVVAWFPPTDLVNWGKPEGFRNIEERRPGFLQGIFGKVTDVESQLKTISPIYHLSKDDPPLLLIHGDKDATVPLQQSQVLKEKYDELGLPVNLIVHPGGGHTYWPGIMSDYPAVWAWFDRYLPPR